MEPKSAKSKIVLQRADTISAKKKTMVARGNYGAALMVLLHIIAIGFLYKLRFAVVILFYKTSKRRGFAPQK